MCCTFYFILEYKANANKPKEDDDDLNTTLKENDKEIYRHDMDTSLSRDSSFVTHTMGSSTDFGREHETSMSSEYSTTSSLPVSVMHSVDTESGSLSTKCSKHCGCEKLGSGKTLTVPLPKPEFLRSGSWSPTESGCLGQHSNPLDGDRNLLNRSFSQPNDLISKTGVEAKRKSFRKKIMKFFKKPKQHKKSPAHSYVPVISSDSSLNATPVAVCTGRNTYSEAAEKPCENLSPLKVEEARRSSLTDSLSSGESMSSPTSPGYESGYMSSEGTV